MIFVVPDLVPVDLVPVDFAAGLDVEDFPVVLFLAGSGSVVFFTKVSSKTSSREVASAPLAALLVTAGAVWISTVSPLLVEPLK